jgi:hypothetical protein
MELDAFTARLGAGQGRVVVAADGGSVFVLGELTPGHLAELAAGDRVEVVQPLDVTGVHFVFADLLLRASSVLPTGFAWEASVVVDGTKRARTRFPLRGERHVRDLAANVSKLAGTHTVGVRLELVEI